MTPDEDRIVQFYEAFNRRAFEHCFAMMAPGVSWRGEVDDRRLEGLDAVRGDFEDTAKALQVRWRPIAMYSPSAGRIEVLARETTISAADGSPRSSVRVRRRFTFAGALISSVEGRQDDQARTFEGVDRLLRQVCDAINTRNVAAIMDCYAADARFIDKLEDGYLNGTQEIRAHFEHLFATMQVTLTLLDYALEPDDRVRAHLQVEARGSSGRLWQDGGVTIWYRLEAGRIVEQDVDDSGEAAP